jgi:pimeloyl-ACP methyl ester carboxylesterase
MPLETINGVKIFIEDYGSGDPLVLVHGSWVDHTEWPFIVPLLAPQFRVTIYDRRGHSRSERPLAQGSIREDVADLAAIIERAGAPAHVLGISMGASISLRLAAEQPALFRTLAAHEPPLLDLLRDDPATRPIAENLAAAFLSVADAVAAGNMEEGARRFHEMILGPGGWDTMLTDDERRMLINNAPTFLDETRDPEILSIDTEALSRFRGPVLLSDGSETPPFFTMVLDRLVAVLPNATRKTFAGAGHIPHVSHPQEYVQVITEFVAAASK